MEARKSIKKLSGRMLIGTRRVRRKVVKERFYKAFKKFNEELFDITRHPDYNYEEALELAGEIDYELKDLKDLSWLDEYKDIEHSTLKDLSRDGKYKDIKRSNLKALSWLFVHKHIRDLEYTGGIFNSAFINNKIKPIDEVEIDLGELKLTHLGYELPCGKLVINGDAGNGAGSGAKKGTKIIVKGGADNYLGFRTEGEIEVEEDAGDKVGKFAKKGSIIKVKRKIGSIHNSCDGTVFWDYDQNIGNYRYKWEDGKEYELKEEIVDRKDKWRRKII